MVDIATERLVLRPIRRGVARALLEGRAPEGVTFAPGYPSPFSLEVMDLLAGARAGEVEGFGEIGSNLGAGGRSAQIGYSVVEPCWGRGYATEALRALLAHLLDREGVTRVTGETMVGHTASRRVMEKAGMREADRRLGEHEDEAVELVVYEAVAP